MSRLAAIAAAALGAVALAGCGGSDSAEPAGPLTIGILSACRGEFAPLYEDTTAGATAPLLERGARFVAWPPASPYAGYEVHGRPVRLAYGCSDGTPDSAREEARQLVEDVGAEIVLGPARDVEGKVVAIFAQNHPGVTVVNGSAANQASTLAVRSTRFFRLLPDAAQWSAGLGSYAYRELGWRTALVVGTETTLGETEAAGFVAEFCAAGGRVVARLWAPPRTLDFDAYAKRTQAAATDGVYSSLGPDALAAFVAASGLEPKRLLVGPSGLEAPALAHLDGAVGALPIDSTARPEAWRRYVASLRRLFPAADPARLQTVAYYDGMSAILTALERADSTSGPDLRRALAGLVLETPHGPVRLDENRNAIVGSLVVRIEDGRTRTIRRLRDVEQTFAGYFTPKTRPPSRLEPPCVRREPAPWAR